MASERRAGDGEAADVGAGSPSATHSLRNPASPSSRTSARHSASTSSACGIVEIVAAHHCLELVRQLAMARLEERPVEEPSRHQSPWNSGFRLLAKAS